MTGSSSRVNTASFRRDPPTKGTQLAPLSWSPRVSEERDIAVLVDGIGKLIEVVHVCEVGSEAEQARK
jgi:hypothetical protein